MEFKINEILDAAIKTIKTIQKLIKEEVYKREHESFEPLIYRKTNKELVAIDLIAEFNSKTKLDKLLKHYKIEMYGEESLRDPLLDLSNHDNLVVLMDMVDGTDLLERRLFNWCSAMIFYYPPQQRIIASLVGIPNEAIYFAAEDRNGAYKYELKPPRRGKISVVTGPSKIKNIHGASISFYGQKLTNFLSICNHKAMVSYFQNILKKKKIQTRIYNFGGNPMMIRLIDGYKKIDVVFDIVGQAPHDVAPGAYIAKKAGAFFCDLKGEQINLSNILVRPADPNSRIQYILASTKGLAQQLLNIFTNN
jgi:fructose-1,6-bisphosphatase/inositol monophosphatase family enzyme